MSLDPVIIRRSVASVSLHAGSPLTVPYEDITSIEWVWPATNRNELVFTVRMGSYSHLGYWTSDGEFLGSRELPEPVWFSLPGEYRIEPGGLSESLSDAN